MNKRGYNSHRLSAFEYEFFTDWGAAYQVEFDAASVYFNNLHPIAHYLYSIQVILLHPGPYYKHDMVIGITLAEIMMSFFEEDERRIVFYLCEPGDKRIEARERKFAYWFRQFNTGDFCSTTADLESTNIHTQLTFIYVRHNPYAGTLPLVIEQAAKNFGSK